MKVKVKILNFFASAFSFVFKTKQNKTKRDKTKQNRTKQNRTKQNKTEQNKTKQTKKRNFFWTSSLTQSCALWFSIKWKEKKEFFSYLDAEDLVRVWTLSVRSVHLSVWWSRPICEDFSLLSVTQYDKCVLYVLFSVLPLVTLSASVSVSRRNVNCQRLMVWL